MGSQCEMVLTIQVCLQEGLILQHHKSNIIRVVKRKWRLLQLIDRSLLAETYNIMILVWPEKNHAMPEGRTCGSWCLFLVHLHEYIQ